MLNGLEVSWVYKARCRPHIDVQSYRISTDDEVFSCLCVVYLRCSLSNRQRH